MDNNNKKIWRKDITGLRAWAVVPVLVFHAFPNLLPGGFYGVDIFFVISGYLISGIIFRGLLSNTFSFKDFYAKRIKRILPNLILVFFVVFVLGWFFASKNEFWRIGGNISHSALFYQNLSLMKESDYFEVLSQNNPLLHIWSLSIEEQFYILFPVLCFLIWKVGKHSRRGLGVFVGIVTVSSFTLCCLISDQMTRFYFPLSRFWELGVGVCVAYCEIFIKFDTKRYGQRCNNVLSCIGIISVILAFIVPTDWYAPSPGVFSLIPVIGSALLIMVNPNSLVNRTVLSWGGVVFVGLISYSLYLWHWPILAYFRLIFYDPSCLQSFAVLLLTFLIAFFVYRYIENPVRRIKSNGLVVFVLLTLLIGAYVLGKIIRYEDGFPDRNIALSLNFQEDWSYPKGLEKSRYSDYLLTTNSVKMPAIIFVGDSHIEQYHARIQDQVSRRNLTAGFVTGAGCMASIGLTTENNRCKHASDILGSILNDQNVRVLVIGQKWGGYPSDIMSYGLEAYAKFVEEFIRVDSSRKVFILLDSPWSEDGEFDIWKYLGSRFDVKNKVLKGNFFVNLPIDDRWKKGNEAILSKFTGNVTFVETASFICPNEKCNLKHYKDNDHLRSTFVREHATWIDQVFE